MNRAFDVLVGVSLIASVWMWMVLSVRIVDPTWLAAVLLLSKVGAACLVTGPIYREYLK